LAKMHPQLRLLRRHPPAQSSRLLVRHDVLPAAPPPTARGAVPPPRSGEGLASHSAPAERRTP
jgi:hypothetical protein